MAKKVDEEDADDEDKKISPENFANSFVSKIEVEAAAYVAVNSTI